MYIDDCRLKGVVNLVLRDKDGKVKQHKTIRNKVTRAGIAHIIGRMIDDGQDRNGLHQMPRMMSHMAVGIGAAARSDQNTYTAQDLDNLPTNIPGGTDPGGTTATSRKKAASAESYDRMLQDERGYRVQLMKDTSLASDYVTLEDVTLAQATDSSSNPIAMHATTSGNSQLIFETGSDSGNTLKRLRVGLQISAIGTIAGSLTDLTAGGTQAGPKITKIESGVAGTSAEATATTITLDSSLAGNAPGSSVTTLYLDIDYVDRIALTTYSTNTAMPNHPTLTHVKSVFQPNDGNSIQLGPFGQAANRPTQDYLGNAYAAGDPRGPIDVDTGRASAGTYGSPGPYTELGVGMLGVTRGQIGAFYERDTEYNVHLLFTDNQGLADSSNTATTGVETVLSESSYATLDWDGTNYTTRFPFIGAEDDKPSGTAVANPPASGLTGTAQNAPNTRGTEFIQFGTATDGIFQGELVGSSIVADAKNAVPEGYPSSENNYGLSGGLLITNASSGEALANYDVSRPVLNYNPSGSYAPNAVAGAKKNGDRIVYVATFKENNPRPETDYDQIHTTTLGTTRAPYNRVYPITEAGIFNKHIKDLGIFDAGARTYTGSDAAATDMANIDTRAGINNATALSGLTTLPLSANGAVTYGPVDSVLTQSGEFIQAGAYGFTQGPLTQTMLCRTTFDPVNKATADTLQITWSVQLQDNT